MKRILQKFEETLNAIKKSELRKNPEASVKAFEIQNMIDELNYLVNANSLDSPNQGLLKYINSKMLLEN